MVRKDTWKGYDDETIKGISHEDFLRLTTSRNRRTLARLKNNPKLKRFMDKVRKARESGKGKMIKTHIRDAVIMPEWLGLMFGVYNGKEYRKVEISIKKIGKRLGDFSHSTTRVLHSGPGVGATRGSKFVPLK
ncbi:MAG: ribosomal protein S19 family protein [Candidatus Micrarchaeota archaeon]